MVRLVVMCAVSVIGASELAAQAPCACNGDVNADNIVNFLDAGCIIQCQGGDCSCCASSCDINCDGAVDSGDVFADDPIGMESTWLCLFQGSPAETCCPGAPAPSGACCDLATGVCEDGATAAQCAGGDLVFSEGLTCADVSCAGPPSGACCNLGNGQCANGLLQGECAGNTIWHQNLACEQVECSVPPQDPCTCNGDVNADGIVNLLDAGCIIQCQGGDCSCCASSCDINCDGAVDSGDVFADNPLGIESTWLCLFQGSPAETCCPGAPAPSGACCDLSTGACEDGLIAVACSGADRLWWEGLVCAAVSCPIPPTGACCNLGNGQCVDGVFEVNCDGDRVWSQGLACKEVDCHVPLPDECLCDGDVNSDGTINLHDAICMMECRAGDCSCCGTSCDINCDGAVDEVDIADDIIGVDSVWRCLFQGSSAEFCCSPDGTPANANRSSRSGMLFPFFRK